MQATDQVSPEVLIQSHLSRALLAPEDQPRMLLTTGKSECSSDDLNIFSPSGNGAVYDCLIPLINAQFATNKTCDTIFDAAQELVDCLTKECNNVDCDDIYSREDLEAIVGFSCPNNSPPECPEGYLMLFEIILICGGVGVVLLIIGIVLCCWKMKCCCFKKPARTVVVQKSGV